MEQLFLFETDKETNKEQWKVFFDGSCTPNPGTMGIGIYIESNDGKNKYEISKVIGQGTSNISEYTAVVTALKEIKKRNLKNVQILGDSTNAVRAIQGLQKSKIHPNLVSLVKEGMKIVEELKSNNIKFTWIPREQNEIADSLSTKR